MAAGRTRAAALLREADSVGILAGPGVDGVLAAGLLGLMLERLGKPWHARVAASLEPEPLAEVAGEAPGRLLVLAGLGGLEPGLLDNLDREVLVLDAREPQAAPARRALLLGDAVPGATAATLAFDLAHALDPRAPAILALAALEATGPWEHADALRAHLAAEAERQGAVPGAVPALGPGALADATAGCVEPYLPGLAGRARAAKRFLERLRLPPGASVADLAPGDAERLASGLVLHLLARGAAAAPARALVAPDLLAAGPGGGARGLAGLCKAACAAARPGLALALALGDLRSEREAAALAEARRERLLQALLRLEASAADSPDLLRADADLAEDVAWAVSASLRGGAPVAVEAGGLLHVAAPAAEPRALGVAAARAAEAVGGRGWALGHRAVLRASGARAAEAWARLRAGLGAGA